MLIDFQDFCTAGKRMKFENRLRFDKVREGLKLGRFFWNTV